MAVINKRDPKFPEKIREMVENLVKRVVDKKIVLDLKEGETVTFTLAHLNLPKEKLVELWLRYMNLSPSLPFISGLHSQAAATSGGPLSAHGSGSWERNVTCEPFTYTENELQANVCVEFLSKLEYIPSESYTPEGGKDPKRKQGPENQPERGAKTPKQGSKEDYSPTVAKMTSSPTSNYTGRPKVKLTIPSMSFGIETTYNNCSSHNQSCDRNCDHYFINKVAIKVCPIGWAQSRLELEPYDSPQMYTIQKNRSDGRGANVGIGPQHAMQLTANFQVTKGVSRDEPAHRWCPASWDLHGNNPSSVNWGWEFLRFADGTEFQFGKAYSRSETQLGFDPASINLMAPLIASWDANPGDASQNIRLAWDITLTVETTLLKGTQGFGKRSYSAHIGPTITYGGQLTFV